MEKQNIFGCVPESLQNVWVEELKLKKYTIKQVFDWIYKKDVYDFEKMTNLSKSTRELLQQKYQFGIPTIFKKEGVDKDATIKLGLELADGCKIEAVYMNDDGKSTFCVSSQVGCVINCGFCATGKMGVRRNLTAGEIVGQVIVFKDVLGEKFPESFRIVYMGMGEPFNNMNQVFKSLDIFTCEYGFNIGSRRITVSTSGITKGIYRMIEVHPQVQLAISLHTIDQQLRNKMMPNCRNTVDEILQAAEDFTAKTGRRITFEIVVFGGKYFPKTARLNRLAQKLKSYKCTVNLIPYNPVEGEETAYKSPTRDEVRYFQKILNQHEMDVTVRYSKGKGIKAACGQLVT
jgi:23S rRNA (adenine2503-C2)-methyltransferase